ncbi:MAG: glycerate kinase [Dehalococcoidia bacterium]|nr:glycerate kinase [Dehalococcoidia bacterium]
MKVVIAPQTFRGGLPGMEVAKAIHEGVVSGWPGAETVLVPVADGGDGTLDALVRSTGGTQFVSRVRGPLQEPVSAVWGVMGDGETAVIEMSKASGLVLIPHRRRNPRITSTHGTGELIAEALQRGYRKIIVGMGGSATNDGGVGMAQALGLHFLDSSGNELSPGGAALSKLAKIDTLDRDVNISDASITAASDVSNPLCGPRGASMVYGPQKGATPEVASELDAALEHYARVIKRTLGVDVKYIPGAGAAGGLGAGLIAFLDAEVKSGADIVRDVLNLNACLDLVITGEARVVSSTAFDKAPVGVAKLAKSRGIPVILLTGSLGTGYESVYQHGVDGVVAVLDRPMRFDESLKRSYVLLRGAAERTMHLLRVGGKLPGDSSPPLAEALEQTGAIGQDGSRDPG